MSVGPSSFQNGPQANVTTIQQGGKSITVTKVRAGRPGRRSMPVWLVTVKGGGHFTLGTGSATTGRPDAGLRHRQSAVAGLDPSWATQRARHDLAPAGGRRLHDHLGQVSRAGHDVRRQRGEPHAQNEIDEVQIQNATGGSIHLTFNGGTITEGNGVTSMSTLSTDLNGAQLRHHRAEQLDGAGRRGRDDSPSSGNI